MEMKLLLASIANVITVLGYAPYFRDIFAGRTKPHAFSWFIWTFLTAIAFSAQVVGGGGKGAWVTGFSALVCFVIFLLALFKGTKEYTRVDVFSLCAALAALVLWGVTDDPLLSVILITITDALGFLPTFRKGYVRPFEETPIAFGLAGVKFVFGIAALQSYSLTTWLYPASLVVMNGVFFAMLLVRRRQLGRSG